MNTGLDADERVSRAGSAEAAYKQAKAERDALSRKSRSKAALALDVVISELDRMWAAERDKAQKAQYLAREKAERQTKEAYRLLGEIADNAHVDTEIRDVTRLVRPALNGGSIDWTELLKAVHAWNGGGGLAVIVELGMSVADNEAKACRDKGDWRGMNEWDADAHTLATVRKSLNDR